MDVSAGRRKKVLPSPEGELMVLFQGVVNLFQSSPLLSTDMTVT